jgi:hypothetical protein
MKIIVLIVLIGIVSALNVIGDPNTLRMPNPPPINNHRYLVIVESHDDEDDNIEHASILEVSMIRWEKKTCKSLGEKTKGAITQRYYERHVEIENIMKIDRSTIDGMCEIVKKMWPICDQMKEGLYDLGGRSLTTQDLYEILFW